MLRKILIVTAFLLAALLALQLFACAAEAAPVAKKVVVTKTAPSSVKLRSHKATAPDNGLNDVRVETNQAKGGSKVSRELALR